MNRKSDLLLVNCNDRVIRLFKVADYDSLNPAQKLTQEQCRARLEKKSVGCGFFSTIRFLVLSRDTVDLHRPVFIRTG